MLSFPGGSVVKNLPANARNLGSIPGSGRSPGESHGNPLQYSYLKNPRDDPGGLQSIGSQRVRRDWRMSKQQLEVMPCYSPHQWSLDFFKVFFFLRIGVAFRDIPMLTVARSSLIKVSVVFLVHLPPPTSSCSPHSSGTHHTNAHPCICISEQPQAPVLRYVNADKGEW